jgi:hypothetical protein
MKIINKIFWIFIGLVILSSCEEDIVTVEDHFLNYEIPEVPVTADYVVGATYQSFGWSGNVVENPAAGQYNAIAGDPATYAQHITWAKEGGIDYFLFEVKSGAKDASMFTGDSTYIATLNQATNASEMNFAISYSYTFPEAYGMELSDQNPIDSTQWLEDGLLSDFRKMVDLFNAPNYMKVNGKCIVLIQAANNLFAVDNAAIYQSLRDEMSGNGIELYIIGEQQSWSPPTRYDFRFENGVDAVSHKTYAMVFKNFYDRYIMFHNFTDQALTISRDAMEEINLEYVPQISPSYNGFILNANSNYYQISKNTEWFTKFCNIAKRSSSDNRLIIIDSFNNWNFDTQIEPAQSYGKDYLSIIREQFKMN